MTRKRRGMILVLTIWVLVLIVAVALGLSYEVELDTRAALNADAKTRAYYAAYAGIERAAAELDQAQEYFSAPGQSWEAFDSDQEPLSVEAEYYRYRTLVSDDCSRLDLNTVDNAALTQIGEGLLDQDQIAAIVQRQAGLQGQATAQTQNGVQTQDAAGAGFRAVDDLLLVEGILPQQVYGVGSWIERLSPADRFRQQWVVIQQGQAATAPPPSGQPDAQVPPLVDLFTVGSAARRLASDGMPRVSLATITREEMQDRLNALNDGDTESASSNGEFRTGGGGSPVSSALGVLQNRSISNWSEVWGAVGNNRDAVRLLADILTLPNSGGPASGQPGATPGGGGAPGGGGGAPGGGGGGGAPGGGGGFPGGGGGPPGGGGGGRGGALWSPPSVRLVTNARQSPRVVSAFFSQPAPRFLLVQGGAGGAAPGPEGGGAEDPSAALPLEGPINLNTASPVVLSALPQMTEAAAQAIVSYRETTPFRSRGDLLRVPEVPQNVFSAIVERVTVLSDRFTVRSLGSAKVVSQGTGRESDLAVHLTATLDRTTGRCRIVRLRQDN